MSMILSNLVQFKSLLLILTAAGGTALSGAMATDYAYAQYHQPPRFQIALNPSTLTLLQNATSTSTITITSIGRYSGTVALTLVFEGQSVQAAINPTRVYVHSGRTASSTLSITAPEKLGNYTIIVIGAGNSRGRPLYSSAVLSLQVVSSQDFTITATPNIINNTIGTTNTTTITVTSINGYTGTVSLSATVPFGYITVTGHQSPLTITSNRGNTSSLDISTTTSTIPGNYTITVTGTDSQRTHATAIQLRVVDPTPPPVVHESLGLYSYSNNQTSLGAVLQNTGNTTVTLQSYSIQDQYGDAWTLSSWAGPSITPSTLSRALIVIGSNCPGCTYTGITGLFSQLQTGQTYTLILTSTRNNTFTYTITLTS
jgi:hypothetical protein